MAAEVIENNPIEMCEERFDSRQSIDARVAPAVDEDGCRGFWILDFGFWIGDFPDRELGAVRAIEGPLLEFDLKVRGVAGQALGEGVAGGVTWGVKHLPDEHRGQECDEQRQREGEEGEQAEHVKSVGCSWFVVRGSLFVVRCSWLAAGATTNNKRRTTN